ncbi:hypothetical protein GCM10010174_60970 [Kutzneria viridogrisea]|uniref:Uncharacterized protein n=1 Tax=Kutzneria viridogrisea TaxID=47990 RepID=A0ABR6BY45_9PSEU|nr:hypothetical protein [Kutzneria viridogrisea]
MTADALHDRLSVTIELITDRDALATRVADIELLLSVAREDPQRARCAREFLDSYLAAGSNPPHLVTELRRALTQLPAPNTNT